MPRNNQIQFRKGSATEWTASNPVLYSGEPGFESDSNRLKIGLGSNWDDTSYISSDSLLTTVYNSTNATISGFSVVYISGGHGNLPAISLSIATTDQTSANTYGVTVKDISSNSRGLVITNGLLKNVDTNKFGTNKEGSSLWLSPTVSGGLTLTKPYAPDHGVFIGTIVRSHNTQGVVEVKIQNGYELEELHDVAVTGVTNGQFLQYNTASGLWLASSSGNFSSLTINNTNIATGTGIANHIAYWNSNSGIVADSGQLYWDNTNNRLGISTTSPESNLHIVGDVTFGNNPKYGGDGFYFSNSSLSVIENNFLNTKIDSNGLSLYGNDEGGAGTSQFFSVDRSNGRVGIGIGNATPAVTLDVLGDGRFSTDLTVGGNLTVNGSVVTANVDRMEIEDPIITLGLASGNIVTTDTLDRGLALIRGTGLTAFMGWDTSASQFVMLSSGVASNSSGIYTPGTYGNLRINDLVCNTGNFNGINVGGPARFSIGAGGFGFQIDRGNIDPGFNGDILKFDVNDSNGVGYSTTLMSDAPGYDIIVKLPADSGTLARLSDINTSQITGVLSVAKGGTNRSTYSNGQLLIGSGTSLAANTLTAGTGISITNGGGTITIDSSIVNPVTGTGVANHIAYWNSSSGIVADSGQLVWDATNNRLGIGVDSPTEKLEIDGFLKFANCTTKIGRLDGNNVSFATSASSLGHYGILIDNTATTNGKKFRLASWADGTTAKFIIRDDSSGVDRFAIDTAGNVGIGTASPGATLDVRGSAVFNEAGSDADFRVEGDTDANLLFVDASTDRVGVGTSTPSDKLNVVGNISAGTISNTQGKFIAYGSASQPNLVFEGFDASGTARISTNSGSNRQLKIENDGASTALGVYIEGDVGIGTTTPGYKLQVNGSFGATTKSFRIDHPSKKGWNLEYGSLESPYHGVRLTGRGKVVKGVGAVDLPDYLKDLIHDDESIVIQLTNYKHSKTLYVDSVDLQNDKFVVKADRAKTLGELEFFWTLTGIRKDVENLVVEKEN